MIGGRGEDRIDRPATYGTHMEHVNSNITRRWAYHASANARRTRRPTNWQFSAGHGNVRGSFETSSTLARPTCACTYARTATGRGDHAEQEARPCVACARAAPLAPPHRLCLPRLVS